MIVTAALALVSSPAAQVQQAPERDSLIGYGSSVACLPDVDGDGVFDFAAGAPGLPVGGIERAGRVLIQSGANREVLGEWTSEYDLGFGSSLRELGDVDRDGFVDFLVGYAPLNGASRTDVRSGKSGELLRTFELLDHDVIPFGDLDGDGSVDILLAGDSPWRVVDAIEDRVLVAVDAELGEPLPAGQFARTPGRFWPVGDVDGDGFVDGVLSGLAPELALSGRAAGAWRDAPLYPERRRVALAESLGSFLEGMEAFVWTAGPAGDLDGDGVQDVLVGATEKDRPSTLLGICGASLRDPRGEAKFIMAQPALDGGVLDEYRHFGETSILLGDINGKPGDEIVCLGQPESGVLRIYALRTEARTSQWSQSIAGHAFRGAEASFAACGDVDADGIPDFLVAAVRRMNRPGTHGDGLIQLRSGSTGRMIWEADSRAAFDTERFLEATLHKRPLLIVQGEAQGPEQLQRLAGSKALANAIPGLLTLHLNGEIARAVGEDFASLPTSAAFRKAYVMGPADDGFEMVLVGRDGRKMERFGLVTSAAEIAEAYGEAEKERQVLERRYRAAASSRGPVVVLQGARHDQDMVRLLRRVASDLRASDVTVVTLTGEGAKCTMGSMEELPGPAYFQTGYGMDRHADLFDMVIIDPAGRLLARYRSPVSAEDVLSAIRYGPGR